MMEKEPYQKVLNAGSYRSKVKHLNEVFQIEDDDDFHHQISKLLF